MNRLPSFRDFILIRVSPWILIWTFAGMLAAQDPDPPHIQSSRLLQASPSPTLELTVQGPELSTSASPFHQLLELQSMPSLVGGPWQTLDVRTRPASPIAPLLWTAEATGPMGFLQLLPQTKITPFSDLTGPTRRVGFMSRHITTSTRNSPEIGTNRSFMVSIWYPADPTLTSSETTQPLYPPQFGIYLFTKDFITVNRPASLITNLVGHALKNAPVSSSGSPSPPSFPVILYGHGGQWFRFDNAHKAAELASRGYVVISLDFYDAFMSVLPNGELALNDSESDFPHTRLSIPLHQFSVLDTRALIDVLEVWNREDPIWKNRLNLDQLGVWGWSFGGAVMAEAALIDPRIKAAMLYDAAFWSAPDLTQSESGLPKPFFCLQSEFSPTTDWANPALDLFQKASSDAYFLRIAGSQHVDFTDLQLINQPTAALRRSQQYQIQYTAAFFDQYLRGIPQTLLLSPPNNPAELVSWLRK